MITISDIGERIYDDCRQFGVATYLKGNIPDGEVTTERIVIYPTQIANGMYWQRCFLDVNWCVPDIDEAASLRLKQIERELVKIYTGTGVIDDSAYTYNKDSTEIAEDKDLKCHYVNVRLLFKIQKVK